MKEMKYRNNFILTIPNDTIIIKNNGQMSIEAFVYKRLN